MPKEEPVAIPPPEIEEVMVESTVITSADAGTQQHYGFDEDRAFFDSLLPTVNTFNIEQRLEFRSEVLNIVKRIRLSTNYT